MAETANLGKLVVQMVLDPSRFQAGVEAVQAGAKALVTGLQRAAAAVNTLQPALENAGDSAQGLTKRFADLAETSNDVLVMGLKAATAAAAGLVAASAYVGVTFEQQMKKVGVIAGATEEQMAALTAEARRLGATTAFSASDAAGAMEVLASAGLKTEEIIAATGQAMVLAGAGGTDLSTSASIVASTLAQFGLQASEAGRIADVFAQATADSQFQVDDLGEALKYGGPVAASFGLSLEETVAIMAQFRDLGLEGSLAGTALRSVFSQASQQTKINADTLAKYNLQLQDVNPNLHSFGEILATVGAVGMTASDAMVVFGVEAGGALATLAQQSAMGSTKLADMTASLNAAAAAGGAATDMYAEMQATVAGAFAELQSAAEEVLLTLYAQYGPALGGLLASVTDFVNEVATAIADRSDDIRGALGGALALVGAYLDEHGADLAKMFAEGVAQVASFAVGLAKVATDLADLIPLVDDLALGMGVIWVATKVAAFASALSEVVTILGAAKLGIRALVVEMTAATGGTFALVAAVGTLVAGLVALIDRYYDAKDAAEQLKAAQDALAGKRATEDATRVAALDAVLERQQAAISATEQELAATGKLTAAKKAELDILRDLTGESAARLEAEGKLVQVGDELRTVASVVEDANLYDVADGYSAIQERIDALKSSAVESARGVEALTTTLAQAKAAAGAGASESTIAQILSGGDLRETITTIAEAEARLEDLKERRKEAAKSATALENERGRVVAAVLDKEVADTQNAESEKLRAKGLAASQSAKAEKEYADQTRDIRFKLQQELLGLDTALTDQIKLEFAARRREIEQTYADQIEKAKDNAAEVARLRKDLEGALSDLEELEARKRAAQDVQIEQDRAKAAKDERTRLLGDLQRLQDADAKESVRLEREKAQAIAGISGNNVDLLLKIAEEYDQKIAAARQKEADDAEAAADALAERHRENARKVAEAVGAAFSSTASAVGTALEKVYGLVEDLIGRALDLFETLTGFSFDLAGMVSDVVSALSEAADEGTTLSTSDAATSAIEGLFADASTFLAVFAEAAPILLKGLAAGLPALLDQVADALPGLVAAVAAAAPTVVQAIADALPGLVQVIVAALPDVATALLEVVDTLVPAVLAALPDLFQGAVEVASTFIQGVLARLPDLVSGLLALLPDLLRGVLAQLPALVKALLLAAKDVVVAVVRALPELVGAILDALPDILTALLEGLLDALPDLVTALVEAIPDLIVAILEAVPYLIAAVVNQLPAIITALIGLIPILIQGLADALPELVTALIGSIGEIVSALVAAAPEIAVALVQAVVGLIADLPDLAVAIGTAFVEGIIGAGEAIYDALVDILSSVWDSITSLFDGGDGDSKGRSASRSRSATGGATDAIAAAVSAARAPTYETLPDQQEARQRPAAGTTGQGSTARVQVVLNGRTVQDVLAVSDARGETTITRSRSTGGAPAGISRGRYNRYSK